MLEPSPLIFNVQLAVLLPVCNLTAWVITSKLNVPDKPAPVSIVAFSASCWIAPAPKTILPIPFGVKFKSILVSPPVADISGALPVAALVTVNSFTADAVVANLTCSKPFSSPMKLPLSIKILFPLASKLPPNWGVVSSTISESKPDPASTSTIAVPVVYTSVFWPWVIATPLQHDLC